jgi:parallel beta-helix repeat protein
MVTSNFDFSPGCLRDVITQINTSGVGGNITFMMPMDEIQLMVPLPGVNADVSILGTNMMTNHDITINANGQPAPALNLTPNSCFSNIIFTNANLYYTVTNTNDSGAGSLREGLNQAAQASNTFINFNISGTPPFTINLLSALPQIGSNISISGGSQPANGYTGKYPKIKIQTNATIDYGFEVTGDNSSISGFTISSFRIAGMYIHNGNNINAYDNYIVKNNSPSYKGVGIYLYSDKNTWIHNNTIAGNNDGIMSTQSKALRIENNKIGTNISGDTIMGNVQNGIEMVASNATIGGSSAWGNVISGNGNTGESYSAGIFTTSSNLVIKGNKIGTDITGELSFPNTNGILNNGGGSFIIGSKENENERNIISGNKLTACYFKATDSIRIEGNFIGVNQSGTQPVKNGEEGIHVWPYEGIKALNIHKNVISGNRGTAITIDCRSASKQPEQINITQNTIGLTADKSDTISNNGNGIFADNVKSSHFLIEGNSVSANKRNGIYLYQCDSALLRNNNVGTDKVYDWGNWQNGIRLESCNLCKIGGSYTAANNVTYYYSNMIGNNHTNGILLEGGKGNLISYNSIFGNVKGISLTNQANNNIQKPVITSISSGVLKGTSSPNAKIEFYYNTETSKTPQGKTYIGSAYANNLGQWVSAKMSNACNIICVAIDVTNNTSEFSGLHSLQIKLGINKDTLYRCDNTPLSINIADTAIHCKWYNADDVVISSANNVIINQPGKYYIKASDACSATTDTFRVAPAVHYEVNRNITICNSDSVYLENKYRHVSGTYTDVLVSSKGCDSIVNTVLTVNPAYQQTDQISICEGESYKGHTASGTYTENLKTKLGCDSIVTTVLTINPAYKRTDQISICEGESYKGHTVSGTFTENLKTSLGCDSIVTTVLTVNRTYNRTDHISICEGESYKGHTTSDTYTENLKTTSGCDSIVTIVLTVSPTYNRTDHISICEGESYKGHTVSGTFTENLKTSLGCDSIVTTVLTVNPAYHRTDHISICEGENYKGHTVSGTFTENLKTTSGCDSIVTTVLTVSPAYNRTDHISICEGESYKGHTVSGTYTENLKTSLGCDSIVTTVLTVNPTYNRTDHISICEGESYNGHTISGTYTENLKTKLGCDSIVTTELTVNPAYNYTDHISICEGENYKGHTVSGTFTENLKTTSGCDSIVTTVLTVSPAYNRTDHISICEGESYNGHTISGTYTENLKTKLGCDSIVTTELTVNPAYNYTDHISICEGENYKGHTVSGTFTENLKTTSGCDSIVTTVLTVSPAYNRTDHISICEGESYKGHTISGTYIENLKTMSGCDSIVTTVLTVSPAYNRTDHISICEGESYKGHTVSGTYTENLKTTSGCDSIVTTVLTVSPAYNRTDHISICEGESYKGHTTSGTYTEDFKTKLGCDSIVTINLMVKSKPQTPQISQIENQLKSNFLQGNQWYADHDGIIAGANGQLYKPIKSGNYFVIVESDGCLSDTSNTVYFLTTETFSLYNNDKINLFPIPVIDYLTVNCNTIIEKIEIYNVLGYRLYQLDRINTDHTKFDLSELKSGCYVLYLYIKDRKEPIIRKIMKE